MLTLRKCNHSIVIHQNITFWRQSAADPVHIYVHIAARGRVGAAQRPHGAYSTAFRPNFKQPPSNDISRLQNQLEAGPCLMAAPIHRTDADRIARAARRRRRLGTDPDRPTASGYIHLAEKPQPGPRRRSAVGDRTPIINPWCDVSIGLTTSSSASARLATP